MEKTTAIDGRDGTRLHLMEVGPADAARCLVIVHGYGEHGGRYSDIAAQAEQRGYRVLVPDMRGHGRSAGARGHVLRFDDYLDDVNVVLDRVHTPPRSTAILGHSNGGLIVARHLASRKPRYAAAVLSSPLLGLAVDAPAWKVAAGKALSRWLPRVSLPTEIRPEWVCRDPEVVERYKTDPLIHHIVNARWYTEAVRAIDEAFRDVDRVSVPVFTIAAGDDKLVDPVAAKRWTSRVSTEGSRFERVDDAFHELLFEREGPEHFERVLDWLDEHVDLHGEGGE